MHAKPAPTEHNERDADTERALELRQIDMLIQRCQNRMEGVSDGILSSATRSATLEMYDKLRDEAQESAAKRSERLQWMQENVQRLQETIVKAAHERELFKSDLAQAVERQWINEADVPKWMKEFDNPNLLEMYRSQWLKDTWEKKYKAGWRTLEADRRNVLNKAMRAGVTSAHLPELAIVEQIELFLAKDRNFYERVSRVKALDAAIDAVASGNLRTLRTCETVLSAASTGKDRCVHPAKVGAWLQKIQADPLRYTPDVIRRYITEWRAARMHYDQLAQRYADDGRPDGCMPMSLHAFLEQPYHARLATLTEWQNRLESAKRQHAAAEDTLEREKTTIRRSIDLKDYTAAEQRLHALRQHHPHDRDVLSIDADLRTRRTHEEAEEQKTTDSDRTARALDGLAAVRQGVPSVLASHYAHIFEQGDPELAAVFFRAMKLRGERRARGATTDDDERIANDTTALIDKTVVLEEEDDDASQVLLTEGTPPSVTMELLLQEHPHRTSALVIEGISFEQQLQLVHINERALAHMRHLQAAA